MKVTLIGLKSVDFTDDNGKRVEGYNMYIGYPDANTVGQATDRQFIFKERLEGFGVTAKELEEFVNGEISIEYNKQGKICAVSV